MLLSISDAIESATESAVENATESAIESRSTSLIHPHGLLCVKAQWSTNMKRVRDA